MGELALRARRAELARRNRELIEAAGRDPVSGVQKLMESQEHADYAS